MSTDPATALRDAFVNESKERLREHAERIRACLKLLTDEQVWQRPNAASNAIGNLLLHLTGNIGAWIVQGIGGQPYARDRQAEFDARGVQPKVALLAELDRILDKTRAILDAVTIGRLLEEQEVFGHRVSGLATIYHVVEHFALHTGQIVSTTKLLTGKPLEEPA
jgi:uncharacterized damage-inducible protein DinB